MIYKTISNSPSLRRKLTHSYVCWNDAFDINELNKIQEICQEFPLQQSLIFGDESVKTETYRNSEHYFFEKNETTEWVFNRFNFVIQSLNNQFYNFDLNGYNKIQYTVYDSQKQGYYNWHTDMYIGSENIDLDDTRKLSLIMPLSQQGEDFIGGEFELNLGDPENPVMIPVYKGQIIAFPSFIIHRVKPILRGVRKSLVIWVEGPKFR